MATKAAQIVEAPEPPVADPALATPPEAIDFDKMFDDLAREDVTPPAVKPVEPVPVEAAAPAAPVEAEVDEPELPLEEPVQPKVTSDEDILKRFAELVETRKTREVAPQPPAMTQQPQAPVEYYSPEEKTALATFEKDWPEHARVMAARERAFAQQLIGYVFSEVATTLRPLFSKVQNVEEYSQIEQIHALIPDYDVMRDPVLQWIDQQPSYLKPAYEYVRDRGTAAEIADLFQRFRQTTGAPIPSPVAPVVRQEEPSLPAAARKAVASLAPVGSKRSVVVQGNDPNNFDAAFETFANSST